MTKKKDQKRPSSMRVETNVRKASAVRNETHTSKLGAAARTHLHRNFNLESGGRTVAGGGWRVGVGLRHHHTVEHAGFIRSKFRP